MLEVRYSEEPHKVIIKDKILYCNYGESLKSLDTWARRWIWNKSKVRRFLKLLEKDGNIVMVNETVTTRITVCNYERYDPKKQKDETHLKRIRNASETHLKPEEEREERKKVKKNKESSPSKKNKSNQKQSLEEFKTTLSAEEHTFILGCQKYFVKYWDRKTTTTKSQYEAYQKLSKRFTMDQVKAVMTFLRKNYESSWKDSLYGAHVQSLSKLTKPRTDDGGIWHIEWIQDRIKERDPVTQKMLPVDPKHRAEADRLKKDVEQKRQQKINKAQNLRNQRLADEQYQVDLQEQAEEMERFLSSTPEERVRQHSEFQAALLKEGVTTQERYDQRIAELTADAESDTLESYMSRMFRGNLIEEIKVKIRGQK